MQNTNWRNRPTAIERVDTSIDTVVYIDESGNANLAPVLKAIQAGKPVPESEKHFTIAACALAVNDLEEVASTVMEIKRRYWEDATFSYSGKTKRVCFHSREIRNRKDPFSPKLIDYGSFIADLSKMMADMPYVLYASHVDKEKHATRYVHPDSPYDLCLTFVLERIAKSLIGKSCIVILESRGTKEDKELLNHIKNLIDHGTQYTSPEKFQLIRGVYFNPKWSASDDSMKTFWGLELADLCAYPIHKFFAHNVTDASYNTLRPKMYGYPCIEGYGLKTFP